uniref:Uncharacterized protein n=1 Tax=Aegilops tauschii subsp. strangulata TaxID=200361 RepID=A0A452YZC0_AEGTS
MKKCLGRSMSIRFCNHKISNSRTQNAEKDISISMSRNGQTEGFLPIYMSAKIDVHEVRKQSHQHLKKHLGISLIRYAQQDACHSQIQKHRDNILAYPAEHQLNLRDQVGLLDSNQVCHLNQFVSTI